MSAQDDKYDPNRKIPIRIKCVMCDGPMKSTKTSRFWTHTPPFRGWAGNDWFCSKDCAAQWGVLKCSTGTDGET